MLPHIRFLAPSNSIDAPSSPAVTLTACAFSATAARLPVLPSGGVVGRVRRAPLHVANIMSQSSSNPAYTFGKVEVSVNSSAVFRWACVSGMP